MTKQQVRDRTKRVTRRLNWWTNKNGNRIVQVGDVLCGCEQVQGRRGKPLVRMGLIKITKLRRERLGLMCDDLVYGAREARLEGFPEMTGSEFVKFFCDSAGPSVNESTIVTRIEYEYLD